MDAALRKVCESLNYEFNDPTLLAAALTHRSHASEHGMLRGRAGRLGPDNERLEFLGDAVLSLVIAQAVWDRVPSAREGELSRMRAAVVNEASLAQTAVRMHLGDALRLGRGESRGGGRTRPSTLADAMEAVFAAVYLDGGIERAKCVVLEALATRIDEVVAGGVIDHKSTLQELLQARHKITPHYVLVATYGPDHDREHEVELRAGDVVSARGRGRTKKDAEQAAAKLALEALEAAEASRASEVSEVSTAGEDDEGQEGGSE